MRSGAKIIQLIPNTSKTKAWYIGNEGELNLQSTREIIAWALIEYQNGQREVCGLVTYNDNIIDASEFTKPGRFVGYSMRE